MSLALRIARYAAAFVLAAGITYALAATFYTQALLGELQSAGFEAPLGVRISESLRNIGGMASSRFGGFAASYAGVVTLGLAIAYAVALGVKQILKPLAPIAYPTAGAAALAVVVWSIISTQGWDALAGARGVTGVGLQMLAGLLGGVVFALARPSKPLRTPTQA
jgi:hypothetical protein